MWSFWFSNKYRIRATYKAEAEREKFCADLRFYKEFEKSGQSIRYEELKKQIESDGFKRRKRELQRFTWKSKPAEKKWKNCNEYYEWLEYRQLKKSVDILRYYVLKKNSVFNAYRQWQPVFEDDFKGLYPDPARWITRYYAGERLLKDTYGVGNDIQLFMSGNVFQQEERLCLEFRKEAVLGKYWDLHLGIIAKEYRYTSGIVSTAFSLRQRLGRFEAKIKVSDSPVEQYFWLSGDGVDTHVNIVKFSKIGYEASYYIKGKEKAALRSGKPMRLKPGWYIFTFVWTAGEWIWKINDCPVATVRGIIPDTAPAMYAGLSLRATKDIPEKKLPMIMQVEWVRFYVMNNFN